MHAPMALTTPLIRMREVAREYELSGKGCFAKDLPLER